MSLEARPHSADDPQQPLSDEIIRETVLEAMRSANLGRAASAQLTVSADAPFFGPTSLHDSLGLVALLLDIEEALQERGCEVVLSDERAMSQTRSPFRTVESLVAYIGVIARG